jgi:hypothetical protein
MSGLSFLLSGLLSGPEGSHEFRDHFLHRHAIGARGEGQCHAVLQDRARQRDDVID